jgi:hypothetical protein
MFRTAAPRAKQPAFNPTSLSSFGLAVGCGRGSSLQLDQVSFSPRFRLGGEKKCSERRSLSQNCQYQLISRQPGCSVKFYLPNRRSGSLPRQCWSFRSLFGQTHYQQTILNCSYQVQIEKGCRPSLNTTGRLLQRWLFFRAPRLMLLALLN